MKGCFGLIIKVIAGVLIFLGLVHIGVIDFIKNKINEKNAASQEKIIDKTKDIVDLSNIDDEYAIARNIEILKNRVIIAEHNATSQKIVILEPKKENILTKNDVLNDNVEQTIEATLQKYKYKPIKFNKIQVVKQGKLYGLEQEIPYVKLKVEIANLPIKDMEGIVGVAELKNNKNLIIISANEKGKYSQIITDAFFEKVKQ